jgi:hypothetical protein
MTKGKEPVNSVLNAKRKKLYGRKEMKKSPKQIPIGKAFRPGKTMKMTMGMLYGKPYYSQVMDCMALVKQGIDRSKQPLAETARLGPVVACENPALLFFRCFHQTRFRGKTTAKKWITL